MLAFATRISDITVEDILLYGFPVLFAILAFVWISVYIIKRQRDAEDDAQPVQGAVSTIISIDHVNANGVALDEWVMFETVSGDRVRLLCKTTNNFIVGDKGYLQWQGSRLLSFARGKTEKVCETTGNVHQNKESGDIIVTDNGMRWKCRCGKENLDGLIRCYYCGQKKPEN